MSPCLICHALEVPKPASFSVFVVNMQATTQVLCQTCRQPAGTHAIRHPHPYKLLKCAAFVQSARQSLADWSESGKPVACPFCHGPADPGPNWVEPPSLTEGEGVWYVRCAKCRARGPERASRDEAKNAWNTRHCSPGRAE